MNYYYLYIPLLFVFNLACKKVSFKNYLLLNYKKVNQAWASFAQNIVQTQTA